MGNQGNKTNLPGIRSLLAEGPITSSEAAIELGISPRGARVGIWVLIHRGHCRKVGRTVESFVKKGPRLQLYEITPQGKQRMHG